MKNDEFSITNAKGKAAQLIKNLILRILLKLLKSDYVAAVSGLELSELLLGC